MAILGCSKLGCSQLETRGQVEDVSHAEGRVGSNICKKGVAHGTCHPLIQRVGASLWQLLLALKRGS